MPSVSAVRGSAPAVMNAGRPRQALMRFASAKRISVSVSQRLHVGRSARLGVPYARSGNIATSVNGSAGGCGKRKRVLGTPRRIARLRYEHLGSRESWHTCRRARSRCRRDGPAQHGVCDDTSHVARCMTRPTLCVCCKPRVRQCNQDAIETCMHPCARESGRERGARSRSPEHLIKRLANKPSKEPRGHTQPRLLVVLLHDLHESGEILQQPVRLTALRVALQIGSR